MMPTYHGTSNYEYGIGGWHSYDMSFRELIENNSESGIAARCLILKQIIKKHGITPSITKEVIEGAIAIAPGCNVTPYYSHRFQGIVVGAWSDLEDLISSYGNRLMQVAYDALNGKGDRDFYYEVNTEETVEFLNNLSHEKALAEAWQFLRLNVGIDKIHESLVEYDDGYSDGDDIESMPMGDIVAALEMSGEDDTLWNAARTAIMIGNEHGAEAEMADDFYKALRDPNDDVPGSLVTFKKDGWYAQRISKKNPKILKPHIFHVIGVEEILDIIKDGSLGSEDNFVDPFLPYGRSERENKSWLNLDEPYYGWSGFDEESAISIFMEEIPSPPRTNGSDGQGQPAPGVPIA